MNSKTASQWNTLDWPNEFFFIGEYYMRKKAHSQSSLKIHLGFVPTTELLYFDLILSMSIPPFMLICGLRLTEQSHRKSNQNEVPVREPILGLCLSSSVVLVNDVMRFHQKPENLGCSMSLDILAYKTCLCGTDLLLSTFFLKGSDSHISCLNSSKKFRSVPQKVKSHISCSCAICCLR